MGRQSVRTGTKQVVFSSRAGRFWLRWSDQTPGSDENEKPGGQFVEYADRAMTQGGR